LFSITVKNKKEKRTSHHITRARKETRKRKENDEMVDENVANEPVSIDGGRGGGASVVRGAGSARNGESWRFGKVEEIDFRRKKRRKRVGPGREDAAALCGWVWARVVREVFAGAARD
jgi:hypothetical protein